MTTEKASAYHGRVYSVNGQKTCPHCTKIISVLDEGPFSDGTVLVECTPVFMKKKTNSKTQNWFWGCENFPRCKNTENRTKTKRERDTSTWAWANSLGGYLND